MELKKLPEEAMEFLQQVSNHVDAILALTDRYEPDRHASILFTHLESVMHRANDLALQGKLKPETFETQAPLIQTVN